MESDAIRDSARTRANLLPPWISATPTAPDAGRGPTLRPRLFSTVGLPEETQFRAWRDEWSPVIEMQESHDPRHGFAAHHTAWKLGPLTLSVVGAPAAGYLRSRAAIRRDGMDHWVVSIVRRGTQGMRTAGHGLTTSSSSAPYVFSLGESFEGQCSDIDWLCLFVPREMFPEFGPTLDRCMHRPLTSGMGQLLAAYLNGMERRLPAMTEPELPRLVEATQALIAACVVPAADTLLAAAAQLDQARMERARRAIRQHLRSPTLTPGRLCRMVGMSRSQLYRLFEPLGGVARYIQSERLREAYRALADPHDLRDIHTIGENLGFFDASTFSRTFRRSFGCTPSHLRTAAQSGQRSAPVLPSSATGKGDLASTLRSL